jgi:hypothetical protein
VADRFCDGDGCTPLVHAAGCTARTLPTATDADMADLVAAEDGFPRSRAAIRHPALAATRRHFRTHPLPKQQNRSRS